MERVGTSALDRARSGDPYAFADLTEPHRRELHLHCYRMLGSLTDADEVLQETMIAAWRGLTTFKGHSSLRVWLYRIATRRCLNAIRDAKRRPLPSPVPPFDPPDPSQLGEPTWLQPYPDHLLDPVDRITQQENLELAFIVALQRLPARQTAAVVLRDVLGFSTTEIADMLTESSTVVKGLLQRGRNTLGRPAPSTRRSELDRNEEHDRARQFAERFAADDIDGLVALLTEDAWLTMPPAAHQYHGHTAIKAFLRASTSWRPDRRFRLEPTRANTQPAFWCSLDDQPAGIIVLTFRGDRISDVTHFLRFRLPVHDSTPPTQGRSRPT